MPKKFDVDTVSVKQFFSSDYRVAVPPYQRRFAWDTEQVDQLWTDFEWAITSGDEEYFLGAILLARKEGEVFEIIDGQQRLATLTMLLAALRDRFEDLGARGQANELHRLIIRTDLRGRQIPVITLGPADAEDLHKYAQLRLGEADRQARGSRPPATKPGRPRKNWVRNAYDYLFKQIERLSTTQDAVDRLIKVAEFVTTDVVMIRSLVQDDSDAYAYILFESENARGLDLSVADLVKNHLFSLAAKRGELPHVTSLWDVLLTTLENAPIPRFLRYHWLSHHSLVTARNLYATIKQYLQRSNKAPRTFLSELVSDGQVFTQLTQPRQGDPEALTLKDLAAMGVAQHVPLLMAAKVKLDTDAFRRMVHLVETLTMRYIIVGNQNPNRLERFYSEWATQLRSGRLVDDFRNACSQLLAEGTITDDTFFEGFRSLVGLPLAHARYILRKIEEHKTGTPELQLAWSGLEIEHILPLSPTDEWVQATGVSAQDLGGHARRLGNLTILSSRINRSASNRPFNVKVDRHYKRPNPRITQELQRFDHWGEDTIAQRQEEFAEMATEIWAL